MWIRGTELRRAFDPQLEEFPDTGVSWWGAKTGGEWDSSQVTTCVSTWCDALETT